MFAVDGVEVNTEGAFFGFEVDRVELPLQAVDHGDLRERNGLIINVCTLGAIRFFSVGMGVPKPGYARAAEWYSHCPVCDL